MNIKTPYYFQCPKCGSQPKVLCKSDNGYLYPLENPHLGRRYLAEGANAVIREANLLEVENTRLRARHAFLRRVLDSPVSLQQTKKSPKDQGDQ